MFQRLFHIRICRKKSWVVLFCTFLFSSLPSVAQQNSLKVTFEFVSIKDTTTFKGVRAGFPHPILSLITVTDQDGRYVHGLADTSRWLGPTDMTQLGVLVDQVWRNIYEYHREDTTIPPNPNVKQMTPEYRVIELYDVEGYGLSVALAMDYSGSLGEDIYISEDAAKVFVRQMSRNDEAAIIKFTGKVNVFQEFTGDTTLLMESLSRPTDNREYTAVFDAIYKAVELTRERTGHSRKAVVAYTDGRDNYSSHRIDDVIAFAKEDSIPVFTIGLGSSINEVNLRRIANETGGVYLHAETVDELAEIYRTIFGLIRGFYVMATATTDPVTNGTWRVIDLTLKNGDVVGSGKGFYQVPYLPSDIRVSKRAETDSISVAGGDTLHYALTGDTVLYSIYVTNDGPGVAWETEVVDVPDDSIRIIDFEITPTTQADGSLLWRLPRIDVNETVRIGYRGVVDTLNVFGLYPITNRVSVTCVSDTSFFNDTDSVVVTYRPLSGVDVIVDKRGIGDSLVVAGGDSTWFVRPGGTIEYRVSVINVGEKTCYDTRVQDVLPPEVELIDFFEGGYTLTGDTLAWSVPSLASRGGRRDYTFHCRVDTTMPPWSVPIINALTVFCDADSNLDNNTDSDTVWVAGIIPEGPQIRVSPASVYEGDSVQVEVMTPVNVTSWDLRIFFESGTWIEMYGDDFIRTHTLAPTVWTTVVPDFSDTWMSTTKAQERVGVIFETVDAWNLTQSDTAYFTINALYPQVRVDPQVIEPGDSVRVDVMTPVHVEGWDLRIFYENGSWTDTYGDAFILATMLSPDVWTTVVPDFSDTWMRTEKAEERVGVILMTTNLWGIARGDTAFFTVRSTDDFVLDENVFKPEYGTPLGLRFKLNSNRRAVINVYDISGTLVKKAADGLYAGGWNFTTWDGTDENGRKVGSGVYVAILTSGQFQKARKFILVR